MSFVSYVDSTPSSARNFDYFYKSTAASINSTNEVPNSCNTSANIPENIECLGQNDFSRLFPPAPGRPRKLGIWSLTDQDSEYLLVGLSPDAIIYVCRITSRIDSLSMVIHRCSCLGRPICNVKHRTPPASLSTRLNSSKVRTMEESPWLEFLNYTRVQLEPQESSLNLKYAFSYWNTPYQWRSTRRMSTSSSTPTVINSSTDTESVRSSTSSVPDMTSSFSSSAPGHSSSSTNTNGLSSHNSSFESNILTATTTPCAGSYPATEDTNSNSHWAWIPGRRRKSTSSFLSKSPGVMTPGGSSEGGAAGIVQQPNLNKSHKGAMTNLEHSRGQSISVASTLRDYEDNRNNNNRDGVQAPRPNNLPFRMQRLKTDPVTPKYRRRNTGNDFMTLSDRQAESSTSSGFSQSQVSKLLYDFKLVENKSDLPIAAINASHNQCTSSHSRLKYVCDVEFFSDLSLDAAEVIVATSLVVIIKAQVFAQHHESNNHLNQKWQNLFKKRNSFTSTSPSKLFMSASPPPPTASASSSTAFRPGASLPSSPSSVWKQISTKMRLKRSSSAKFEIMSTTPSTTELPLNHLRREPGEGILSQQLAQIKAASDACRRERAISSAACSHNPSPRESSLEIGIVDSVNLQALDTGDTISVSENLVAQDDDETVNRGEIILADPSYFKDFESTREIPVIDAVVYEVDSDGE